MQKQPNPLCAVPVSAHSRGCDIGSGSTPVTYKTTTQPPSTGMDQVPLELQQKMKEYAASLRRKFPTMKSDRIAKKTAAYFKVKLL